MVYLFTKIKNWIKFHDYTWYTHYSYFQLLQDIEKLETESTYYQRTLNETREFAKDQKRKVYILTEKFKSLNEEKQKVKCVVKHA